MDRIELIACLVDWQIGSFTHPSLRPFVPYWDTWLLPSDNDLVVLVVLVVAGEEEQESGGGRGQTTSVLQQRTLTVRSHSSIPRK